MLIHRSFKYRIYPTKEQEVLLLNWERVQRLLWNLGWKQWKSRPKSERRHPDLTVQFRELTALRKENAWVEEAPRNASDCTLVNLADAWSQHLWGKSVKKALHGKNKKGTKEQKKEPNQEKKKKEDRPGEPKRKLHWAAPGLCEPHGERFKVGPDFVTFPNLGKVRATVHRPLQGTQKSITIKRDVDQWFASVLCEIDIADPVPSTKPAVGIDRGVVNVLADSEGRIVASDRARQVKLEAQIALAHQAWSRKVPKSKNKQKARQKLDRLYRKQRRQREHLAHQQSLYYAKTYGMVALEKLEIKNMTASASGTVEEPGTNVRQKAGLNRRILSSCWGKFATMVKYKVVPEGGEVRERPAAFSSCTCSECGHVDRSSRVSQAVFRCTGCGHEEHADINAANIILQRGLAEEQSVTACEEQEA